MKRVWGVAMVVLVCTPMLLTMLLFLAVESPKMDAVTMHLPTELRAMVVTGILTEGNTKDFRTRAMRLEPVTAEAFRQQTVQVESLVSGQTPPKLQALYTEQLEAKKAAKDLTKRAQELEKAGQECAAEDLYTEAAGKDTSPEIYTYTEGIGRAGLKCGDLPGAQAGLEAAILKETDFIKGTDEDQLTGVRQDMLKDREYLVVVYDKQHEAALAKQACSDAHPGWKGCGCKLGKGDVACVAQ